MSGVLYELPKVGPGVIAVSEVPDSSCSRLIRGLSGVETDPIRIESIHVTPDPPQPGQDLTVTVKGTVVEQIEVGSFKNKNSVISTQSCL